MDLKRPLGSDHFDQLGHFAGEMINFVRILAFREAASKQCMVLIRFVLDYFHAFTAASFIFRGFCNGEELANLVLDMKKHRCYNCSWLVCLLSYLLNCKRQNDSARRKIVVSILSEYLVGTWGVDEVLYLQFFDEHFKPAGNMNYAWVWTLLDK